MSGKGIELSQAEQQRILGEIDLVIENRKMNGTPQEESSTITFLWAIIGELRVFCQFLGAGLGLQQVIGLEQRAKELAVTTPAVLLFMLYRTLKASPENRKIIAPKWLADVVNEIEDDEQTEEETESSE